VPRQRNPVGIAAGKLILAIRNEWSAAVEESDKALAQKIIDRAHTLLQASQSSSVSSLLDGRSVTEYLDPAWVEKHPSVEPSVVAFVAALNAHENV
jgi:hypothetical protein